MHDLTSINQSRKTGLKDVGWLACCSSALCSQQLPIASNLSSNLAQLNFVFNKARPLGKLEMKLAIKILAWVRRAFTIQMWLRRMGLGDLQLDVLTMRDTDTGGLEIKHLFAIGLPFVSPPGTRLLDENEIITMRIQTSEFCLIIMETMQKYIISIVFWMENL